MLSARVFTWGNVRGLEDAVNEFISRKGLRRDQIISVTQSESVSISENSSFTITLIYEDVSGCLCLDCGRAVK